MPKKFSSRFLLLPIVLITQIVLLGGLGLILRAGTGSLNNSDHLPVNSNLYIVVLDTDQYTRKVGKEVYKGLPDSHDFSKEKDFFGLFAGLYCSGKKKGDNYEADYCSSWGKQLFDLQRLWRVWGVDLIKEKLIGSAPKTIYAGLLTVAASVGLSITCSFLAFFSYWGAVVATALSWISSVAIACTSGLSYTFANRLIKHSTNLKTTGSGKIVVHYGKDFFLFLWVGIGISTFASITLSFVTWRLGKGRSKAKQHTFTSQFPLMGVVRRATSGFRGQSSSYKHIEEEVLHDASKDQAKGFRVLSISQSSSPEREGTADHARGRLLSTDTSYEPMRHK